MPNVVRAGDVNVTGGIVTVGAATVKCEGLPVAGPGSPVSPHFPCGFPAQDKHCTALTTGGSSTVKCEGKPVLMSTDLDSCNHPRQTFAATVTVGA